MASQEEDSKPTENMPAQKEKLRSIMEAASALTSLGDEESETGSRPSSPTCKNEEEPKESATKETVVNEEDATEGKQGETKETSAKRFLPEHKKPDAAPTFPEKVSIFDSSLSINAHVDYLLFHTIDNFSSVLIKLAIRFDVLFLICFVLLSQTANFEYLPSYNKLLLKRSILLNSS
jgi:hypothetical protein